MEELRFRNTPLHDLGTQVLETLAARNQVSRIDTPTKTSALGKVLNEFLDQGRVAEQQTKVGVFWDYGECIGSLDETITNFRVRKLPRPKRSIRFRRDERDAPHPHPIWKGLLHPGLR